jgi:ketosteroid isomerase-like protein
MSRCRLLVLAALALVSLGVAPPSKEEPEHKEIKAVRDAVMEAFAKGDVDGMLSHVHPNVVATWQNGKTVRGHSGVRKIYEETLGASDSTVRKLGLKLVMDDLSVFGQDRSTAIAAGSMDNQCELRDGKTFDLASRWTAALIKEEGAWKIIAFHISTDVFDNGVLSLLLRTSVMWTAIAAGAVGLLLGIAAGVRFGRRRTRAG